MKATFERHGIPEKVVSDNGPQFSVQGFARFTSDWDFSHVTSSPTSVHTAKPLLKKARLEKRDPYLSLLKCSTTSNQLRLNVVHPELAGDRMEQKQATQRRLL